MTEQTDNSKEMTVSSKEEIENVQGIFSIMGEPATDKEILSKLSLCKENPDLLERLLKHRNMSKVKDITRYLDSMYSKMMSDSSLKLPAIKVTKKLENNKADFRIGMFSMGDSDSPFKEFFFYPLIGFYNRTYFDTFGSNKPPLCKSINNFQGLVSGDKPYVRECASCPFKEFGVSAAGKVVPGTFTRPLCRAQANFIGVTPDLNNLYELQLNTFCLNRNKYNADEKITTYVNNYPDKPKLDIPPEELNRYSLHSFSPDGSNLERNKWLLISGTDVVKDNKVISGATVVKQSTRLISLDEITFFPLLKRLALDYVTYTYNGFLDEIDRVVNSVSVTDTKENVIEVPVEYAELANMTAAKNKDPDAYIDEIN
jgi:hypothetical protein